MLFLHGFTQTSSSWKPIAGSLATDGYECLVVDLPGHGVSSAIRADLRSGADLLAPFGPAAFVGYSMGGRFALQTAITHPQAVTGLAVLGASPGIDDERERAARRAHDAQLAEQVEDTELEDFLRGWTTQALFGELQLGEDDLRARLNNTTDGLASSLRLAGTGSQLSLWQRLGELGMPVLTMAGADDHKFTAIGRDMVERIHETNVDARFVPIDGAAHAAHLQRPELVRAALSDFLRSLPR